MQQEFAGAFTSVFNQVKGGRCPYFYVCAQRFTVLFRASGLAGLDDINVRIAPTSKGLRDGLNVEGIEYSMPLGFSKRRSTTTTTTMTPFTATTGGGDVNDAAATTAAAVVEDVEAEEDDLATSAASNWLESMGIDKSKFPTLNPTRVSLAQDNFKVLDGRPESLVVIEGGRYTHS